MGHPGCEHNIFSIKNVHILHYQAVMPLLLQHPKPSSPILHEETVYLRTVQEPAVLH